MGTPARVVVLPQESSVLRVEDVVLPDPGPRDVLVKQYASGVCHSQLHQMHGPRNSNVILGHESTGVVLKAGSDVTHVAEGDMVLVTWVPRNAAEATQAPGRATLEVSDGLAIAGEKVFTWADHTLVDEQFIVKVADNTPRDVSSIIGCAVMTGAGAVMNTANVQKGQSVAIFGVGGVGLSAIVGAKMVGADPIIAIDLDDTKLEFAKQFGATHTINARDQDPVAAVHALTPHQDGITFLDQPITGADFTFDCIGLKQTMGQIVPAARTGRFGACDGGTGVLVGVPTENADIDSRDVLLNEKHFIGTLGGSCVPDRDFQTFLDWHHSGDLDLDAMVTARFKIDQINEATQALENGEISGRAILEFDH